MAVLGTVAGGGLGAVAGNKIADSNFLGGLTGNSTVKSNNENAEQCVKYGERYAMDKDSAYLTRMLSSAHKIDTSKATGNDEAVLENAIKNLRNAMMDVPKYTELSKDYKSGDPNYEHGKCVAPFDKEEKILGYYVDCTGAVEKPNICGTRTGILLQVSMPAGFVDNGDTMKRGYLYKCYREINKTTDTEITATALNERVSALIDACSAFTDNKSGQKTKSISTAIGAGVGAIAGGVLAYQATKSIQDAKLDSVEKAAYDEWMSEVGNHIRCFVGGDEVGMYGDIISTSME